MRFNTRGKAISTERNLKNIELKESERRKRRVAQQRRGRDQRVTKQKEI
jgi:hypothetical protein